MEIVKQNETYQIFDINEKGWEMTGTANKDVSGSLTISFAVSKSEELVESIGDCTYSKPFNNGMISVSYSVSEVKRDEFVSYMDSVIDSVLQHFNQAS